MFALKSNFDIHYRYAIAKTCPILHLITCGRRAALKPGIKLGELIAITAACACATVLNVT